jgi:hypothetical protein
MINDKRRARSGQALKDTLVVDIYICIVSEKRLADKYLFGHPGDCLTAGVR